MNFENSGQKQHLLLISAIWPEVDSSAAGVRTLSLVLALQSLGWIVLLASPGRNESWREKWQAGSWSWQGRKLTPVRCVSIFLNDRLSNFEILAQIPKIHCVIYDRFTLYEQFSWLVSEYFPDAMDLVDTQDLASLRAGRERLLEHSRGDEADLDPEVWRREFSVMSAADASFLVSDAEFQICRNVGAEIIDKIIVSRFLASQNLALDPSVVSSQYRNRLVFLGNYRHPPNRDAVHVFVRKIWPAIRSCTPSLEFHAHGAYPSREDMALASPEQGVFIHGPAKDLSAVFRKALALAAPLRFGSGIKGKILEAWAHGVPVITTSMGAEGMSGSSGLFPGVVVSPGGDAEQWARAVRILSENSKDRDEWVRRGYECLAELYSWEALCLSVSEGLRIAAENREKRQTAPNSIFRWNALERYRWFSQFIELKSSRRKSPAAVDT